MIIPLVTLEPWSMLSPLPCYRVVMNNKLHIKQSLDAIMNHPTLEVSPEGQELFAHFAALLDGSSNEVFLSARLSQDAPDPEKSHSAPHLRLLSGGKEE
ncbi:hypothetical protein [Yersinia enterocolitica]|uniref:hypothetical protein n=1 Tax=Yersinia enterocolitica TaxID=630 RepID=UPI000FDCCD5B|nr:hypothetical protein [Yersinia enterocolitica]HDL7734737.1 hypothetical protein [Yersinia enterocolitica]HDL8479354.1 hypothetical protein [Yersinia enterocolitica]HDL8507675.1 hypothetical protein [Yersinia enterocolitica]HEK6321227.1 hypothetical protein [Yersinia enterocolitica]